MHHATVFGLHTERDMEMLAQWVRIFSLSDFTPAEFREATDWLAVHSPPDRREGHLAALQQRVRDVRSAQCAKEGPPEDPRGTCTLCDGTGRVIVPRFSGTRLASGAIIPSDGRYRTMAVLCSCLLGGWFAQRQSDRRQMTLKQYETEFSRDYWQGEVARHEQELLARPGVKAVTQAADRDLGPIGGKR